MRVSRLPQHAWGLAALLLLAAPLLALIVKGAARVSVGLVGHLGRTVLPMQLGYSLLVAAGAAVLAIALALGGLGCARFSFPGRRLLATLLPLPLLLPSWFLAELYRDRHGLQGAAALALVLAVSGAPLVQLLGGAALRTLPPRYSTLLRLLDRTAPGAAIRILGPLVVPAVALAGLLVFLLAWSDATSARSLAVPTVTVGLYDQWFGLEDDRAGAVLALVLLLLSLAPVLLLGWLLRGAVFPDTARLQPGPAALFPLRGWHAAMPWLLSLPELLLGLLLPGLGIAAWAAERLERVDPAGLAADLARTLSLVVGTTLLAALLAVPLLRARAFSGRGSTPTRWLALALFALPPSVLGLSVLWLLATADDHGLLATLNASILPLLAAGGLRYAAVFVVAGELPLRARAAGHCRLARLLGRTGPLSFLYLLRPFLAGPAAVAAAFVLLEAIKDLSLSTLLQPFGFTTLATRLFQHLQTGSLRDGAVWVLCTALVGLYPLYVLSRPAQAAPQDQEG
jgi:iron(III) transport system permease protein